MCHPNSAAIEPGPNFGIGDGGQVGVVDGVAAERHKHHSDAEHRNEGAGEFVPLTLAGKGRSSKIQNEVGRGSNAGNAPRYRWSAMGLPGSLQGGWNLRSEIAIRPVGFTHPTFRRQA